MLKILQKTNSSPPCKTKKGTFGTRLLTSTRLAIFTGFSSFTLSLALSLPLSVYLSVCLSFCLSVSSLRAQIPPPLLSLSLSLFLNFSLARALSISMYFNLNLSLSRARARALCLSRTHTHTHSTCEVRCASATDTYRNDVLACDHGVCDGGMCLLGEYNAVQWLETKRQSSWNFMFSGSGDSRHTHPVTCSDTPRTRAAVNTIQVCGGGGGVRAVMIYIYIYIHTYIHIHIILTLTTHTHTHRRGQRRWRSTLLWAQGSITMTLPTQS